MKKRIMIVSLLASIGLSACGGNHSTTTPNTSSASKPYQEIELEHLEGRFPQLDLDAMEDELEEEVNEKGLKYRADDFAGYLAIAEEDQEQAKEEYPEYKFISYMYYFNSKLHKDAKKKEAAKKTTVVTSKPKPKQVQTTKPIVKPTKPASTTQTKKSVTSGTTKTGTSKPKVVISKPKPSTPKKTK